MKRVRGSEQLNVEEGGKGIGFSLGQSSDIATLKQLQKSRTFLGTRCYEKKYIVSHCFPRYLFIYFSSFPRLVHPFFGAPGSLFQTADNGMI